MVFITNYNNTYAQENNEKLSVSIDVASGYVWRGLLLNSLPVLQPSIVFSLSKFSIGTWASTPFFSKDDQLQEIDLFVNYRILPFLSLNITDYYAYNSNLSNSYFNYDKEVTCHALDLQLIYTGNESFPLKAIVSTIIAGNDLNAKRKNNYSTYIELGYGNTCKQVDWEVFAGMVPMSSSFYDVNCINIINLGLGVSKSFQISPTYSLPLSIKFTVNPALESICLTAAITLFGVN
jgi:hypothetical protein